MHYILQYFLALCQIEMSVTDSSRVWTWLVHPSNLHRFLVVLAPAHGSNRFKWQSTRRGSIEGCSWSSVRVTSGLSREDTKKHFLPECPHLRNATYEENYKLTPTNTIPPTNPIWRSTHEIDTNDLSVRVVSSLTMLSHSFDPNECSINSSRHRQSSIHHCFRSFSALQTNITGHSAPLFQISKIWCIPTSSQLSH